jgi:DNA-binding response OmpR family regulator
VNPADLSPLPDGRPAVAPTILVADDDTQVRELLCDLLHEQGFAVPAAATGRQVLDRLRQAPVRLEILDLVMPEMEGLETLQVLAESYPDLRVLAISGAFEGWFLDCAHFLGARAILKKPFRNDEFLATVRTLL